MFSWSEYLYIVDRVCHIVPVLAFKCKLKSDALILYPDLDTATTFVLCVTEPPHNILVLLVKVKLIRKLEEFLVHLIGFRCIVKNNEVDIAASIDCEGLKTSFLASMKSALRVT